MAYTDYGKIPSMDTPGQPRDDALAIMLAEYSNPKYVRDKPALAREIARLGGTIPDEGAQVVEPFADNANLPGALASVMTQPKAAPKVPTVQGALSSVPQREPFDLQKMISQYAPQDDSSSKYFAMAAALGKPTRFGSLGEVFGNVAGALAEHKQNQEKLRAQYVPLIMQQVAAQQAREEQAAYRMEAQKAQMEAAQQAQAAQQAFSQQQQAERLANQNQLASQHEALLRSINGNKPEPAPQIITNTEGVFKLGRDGQLEQLKDPSTQKPLAGKQSIDQKPIPSAILKEQNEILTQIGTVSGLNSDLSDLEKQVKTGKVNLGPLNNAESWVRNKTGLSTPESVNYASFNAKIENMRNSILLLNKGVQTEGDAQRALKELFDNINDKDVVKQRLAEIRRLNERAVELKKHQVNTLRSEFGHPEMDFSKYEKLPSSLVGGAATGSWGDSATPDAAKSLVDMYRSKEGKQ